MVSNLLRLLGLPEPVREMLHCGKIDMGHARSLLSLPVLKQIEIAQQVVRKGLSVRETERLVQQLLEGAPVREIKPVDPDVARLQEEVAERIGAKVLIKPGKKGSGRITIDYASLDQLDDLLGRLR